MKAFCWILFTDLSITMTAAVPSAVCARTRSSKSIRTLSHTCRGMMGVEEPPGMTPKRLSHPPVTPPAPVRGDRGWSPVGMNVSTEVEGKHTCMSLYELSQRNGHLFLHRAGGIDVAGDVEEFSPRVSLSAKARKPCTAPAADFRCHGNRFHVGHCGRASKHPWRR